MPDVASNYVQLKLSIKNSWRPIMAQAFRQASNIFNVNKQFYTHFYDH